ncbi:hypothetical protein I9H06_09190 [Pseudomonas tremae]|uniref:hypothetical protein n=1 Tax=Pseudomonas TaxID=286 RepID=UPI000BB5D367|nr:MULTISPECIES: hypothetical protein [Pseudomonas]MCF5713759.1 hypothetical protein [Pseudomonas tremae]PBP96438.1 hypothetical protein CCL24_15840 [Pseudomonas congelans]UQB33396.1 hypothetical protein I9H06_09190 [Pseudomonas tremae]
MNKPTPRFTIDKEQLKMRQDAAVKAYNASTSLHQLDVGMAAILSFDFGQVADAFKDFHDKLSAGWTIPEAMGVSFVSVAPGVMGVSLGGYTVMYLLKPEPVREKEIVAIKAQVEVDYSTELEAQRNAEIERVTEQQLAQARAHRAQQQAAADHAEREAVRAEVAAALAGGKQ